MVDEAVFVRCVADIRDAVARIRQVLPPRLEDFVQDRTAREVVALNLFVALQQALALATHWLADARRKVPSAYRDVFLALGEDASIPPGLAGRLADGAGLRNLIAHRYGVLDWRRIYAVAAADLDDLLAFCDRLAERLGE